MITIVDHCCKGMFKNNKVQLCSSSIHCTGPVSKTDKVNSILHSPQLKLTKRVHSTPIMHLQPIFRLQSLYDTLYRICSAK